MCDEKHNQGRRNFLVAALAAGGAASLPGLAAAGPQRRVNQFSELRGEVFVNGRLAALSTRVRPGDDVRTGQNSKAVFVVGKDAFLLRSNSRLILQQDKGFSGLRLLAGAMMAVFAPGRKTISTPTATAGIRGTGIYVEARQHETYFCTCYGAVQLDEPTGQQVGELVKASHHAARVVRPGAALEAAPMINHEDVELELLESLVGRKVPF